MNQSEPQYSIVIPCLNEEKSLPAVFAKLQEGMTCITEPGEVLLVDNGSNDNSCKIAEQHGARVLHCSEKGYGRALCVGIEGAKSEYVIFADADGSYDFSRIDLFYQALVRGGELVIGSRLRGRIEKGAMPFLHRYLGTPVLTWLINFFFHTNISDCNCGMRGIRRRAFQKMKLISPGMEFASEMVVKAALLRLVIREIPINFFRDQRGRKPHLHTWSDGWRHLRFILIFAPDYFFIYPGALLFLLGSILVFLQAQGPVLIGGVYMDLHFMVFGVMASLLGTSIFLMGVTIKQFSIQQAYYIRDFTIQSFQKISFEKKLLVGMVNIIIGLGISIRVVTKWIETDLANPDMLRATLFSFYFLSLGTMIALFALLEIVMKTGKKTSS